jgi:hypothetical protein
MTGNEFQRALRAFTQRRPFRSFYIEFGSGDRLLISHPEVIRRYGELFLYFAPDKSYRIFAAAHVGQLLDMPSTALPR